MPKLGGMGLDTMMQAEPQGVPIGGDIPMVEEVTTANDPFIQTAEQVKEDETAYEEDVQYKLSSEQKAEIADYIVRLVDQCERDRADWKSLRLESLDLLEGKRAPKSDPWPNCSNISTMATATHCKLMHAKIFPAVWNENLIYWRPMEKNDIDNTDKVTKFMTWVVRQNMKLQDTIDDLIWDWIVNGTIALKMRWVTTYRKVSYKDPATGEIKYEEKPFQKCVMDNVSIDDVYLPNLWRGVDDSEYIGQNIYMRLPEIEDFVSRKIYQGDDIVTKVTPKIDEQVPDSLLQKKTQMEGSNASEIASFKNSMPVRLIEFCMQWPINGKMTESVFTIGYESKAYLSGKPLAAVSPIGRRPWVIGQFIQRTGRPYGIGLPEWMRGLAKELDAIHNQRIDAGTIGIAPFGFYRAASSFRPANVQVGPGVMVPVDDINDVKIIQLSFNPVASFQEEKIIIEYIEKLTTTSAYQMGRESDIVKSRATATGTMAIISQGEQSFTILGIRAQSIISKALTQVLWQYQMFMPEGYADRVLGEAPGELLFPKGMGRTDISGEYDCYMTLDAIVGNKSMERQINGTMVQMGPTLMALAQDPRGYEIAKDFLVSLGKVDVEKYIGPKPKGSPVSRLPPAGPGLDIQGSPPGDGGMSGGGMGQSGGGLPNG